MVGICNCSRDIVVAVAFAMAPQLWCDLQSRVQPHQIISVMFVRIFTKI